MNPQLFSALEKIKTGDLKSAMDQLRFFCSQLSNVQQDVENLYLELDKKVALEGATTVTKVGSGIISSITNSGTVLHGAGTLFSKEAAIGNTIKIGSESTVIVSLDATTPDVKLTVSPALVGSYTNQIYAIVKAMTKEVLTGYYDFGILNGNTFKGVVRQSSTFELYGRMSQPNDAVNVQYVQNAVNPVMVRAQNAIQRDGDIVQGLSNVNRYVYAYKYTDFNYENAKINFGNDTNAYVEVHYYGPMTDPTHMVTVQKLTDTQTAIETPYYATWNCLENTTNGQLITIGSNAIKCRFVANVPPDESTPNFMNFFDITSSGIKVKASAIPAGKSGLLVLVNAGASYGENKGADQYRVNMVIYKNSTLVAKGRSEFDGPTGFSAYPNVGVSATVMLGVNDVLVPGVLTNNNLSLSQMLDHYLNITKVGIF